jgi:hypothetical protein
MFVPHCVKFDVETFHEFVFTESIQEINLHCETRDAVDSHT